MRNSGGSSRENAKQLIADTLRLYVGRGKRVTWHDLHEATGIEERTLRSYSEPDGPLMPLDVFFEVFPRLPDGALAKVGRDGMGVAIAPIDNGDCATVRRMLAETARLVAQGNEFLEDGVLSHTERAALAQSAGELMPTIQQIAGKPRTD